MTQSALSPIRLILYKLSLCVNVNTNTTIGKLCSYRLTRGRRLNMKRNPRSIAIYRTLSGRYFVTRICSKDVVTFSLVAYVILLARQLLINFFIFFYYLDYLDYFYVKLAISLNRCHNFR